MVGSVKKVNKVEEKRSKKNDRLRLGVGLVKECPVLDEHE